MVLSPSLAVPSPIPKKLTITASYSLGQLVLDGTIYHTYSLEHIE